MKTFALSVFGLFALSVIPTGCNVPIEESREAVSEPLINIDPAGCHELSINDAIGQSFKVRSRVILDRIDIWIRPQQVFKTLYRVALIQGEGQGTSLGISPRLEVGCLERLAPEVCDREESTGWRSFSFADQNITLQPNTAYTFKLVRDSTDSGGFASCPDVYPDGVEYWRGEEPQIQEDVAFRLFGKSEGAAGVSIARLSSEVPPCIQDGQAAGQRAGEIYCKRLRGVIIPDRDHVPPPFMCERDVGWLCQFAFRQFVDSAHGCRQESLADPHYLLQAVETACKARGAP